MTTPSTISFHDFCLKFHDIDLPLTEDDEVIPCPECHGMCNLFAWWAEYGDCDTCGGRAEMSLRELYAEQVRIDMQKLEQWHKAGIEKLLKTAA